MRQRRQASVNVFLFLVGVNLLCCSASSQIVTQYGTSNSNALYKISGTVVNSVTGEPIRRALVQIYLGAQRMVFTDSNGQFEFDNLPAGQASVTARKPGYFDQREADGGGSMPMATIGPDSQPLMLKLVPQSVIYGRIQDINGEPIEGLPLRVMINRVIEGRKRWQDSGTSATDEDGEFRVAHLLPGSYYLVVGPSRGLAEASAGDRGYPALLYPGVPDIDSASPFQVGPGQQMEADLSLHSVPMFKVSGTLVGYGRGGLDMEFIDGLGNRFSFLKKFNPPTGEFEAEVPAGQYRLQVTDWSTDGKSTQAETGLNVTSDVSGVALALGPILPVPVTVRTEASRPEDLRQTGQGVIGLLNVHLIRDDDMFGPSDASSNVQPGSPPSIVISNVAPGRYTVDITTNGNWYVQSAQCGAVDLLGEKLTITAGAQPIPIEIVLRDDSASLEVQVKAAQTQADAKLLIVPENGSGGQIKSFNAAPGTDFFVPNLAPGNYNVLAFDHADTLEYTNPDIMEPYLSKATHVTLQRGGRQKISVETIELGN